VNISVAIVTASIASVLASPSAEVGADRVWETATPVTEVNSAAADGCPFEAPNGRRLFIASTRPGGLGLNDIWVAERQRKTDPWSTPVNVGAPVNSTANDFCPTPLPGIELLFVSERSGPGTCNAGPGIGDIYRSRLNPAHGPTEPEHLGCVADGTGPNFAGPEFSPSLVRSDDGTWLFFSSTGLLGNMDLYVSEQRADGSFAPPTRIDELSTAADDRMPNVSRDGLTMVFSSTRTDLEGEQGMFDVYMSTRASTSDTWSTPVNLGPAVNTGAAETRPSLSGDLVRLYFGRSGDIWVTQRAG
jgi:hypothetical protein